MLNTVLRIERDLRERLRPEYRKLNIRYCELKNRTHLYFVIFDNAGYHQEFIRDVKFKTEPSSYDEQFNGIAQHLETYVK
jgi:hypothetical protein